MVDPAILAPTTTAAVEAIAPAAVAVIDNTGLYVSAGVASLTLLVNGIVAVLIAKLNRRAIRDEEDRAIVKDTLKTSTSESSARMGRLEKVTTDTHTLVNANMGKQLKISALALRRIADMTQHPDDDTAARLAEDALAEHEGKQAVVDARAV